MTDFIAKRNPKPSKWRYAKPTKSRSIERDFLCIFTKDIFTKNQMRFLYKLPIDNRTEMWYNGGPVAGDSARVLPIGSICKIFVQSSTPRYADRFSRKFDVLSQIYFVPSIQSFFHFHLAYSPLHFHVANKFLVAHSEPPALPIGPSFISKQEER